MDEWTLNDLLECSVCLERLDTSSKVLPCQHTFCKKCLEEIVSTHKELRCPECRVLVDAKIEDLPPNVLLMRILEGMRNAAPKKRNAVPNRMQGGSFPQPTVQQLVPHSTTAIPPPDSISRPHPSPKQLVQPNQPYARAVYDYIAKEPGDLSFKKGDIIILRKKIDTNWYHGESGGNYGAFPLTYVQVITPLPSQIAQCKALYDFRMTNDDEEGCLTFNKGEVITVLRRVDENWAEGKLGDRIGIFPLAFVELNIVARALMKLSTNCQPGPSRVAPPTPTSEDTTPLIPTDHSRTVSSQVGNTMIVATHPIPQQQQQQPPTHQHITMGTSDSSSTVSSASSSTTTPNTSSSNTSSSSSTAPSSPTSPPPPRTAQSTTISPPPHNVVTPAPPRPAHNPTTSPPHAPQHRDKRHSFSVIHSGHHHQTSHRHSAEILSPTESIPQDCLTPEHALQAQIGGSGDIIQRQGSQRHRRSGSSDLSAGPPPLPQGSHHITLATTAHLPAAYIALYPYKPQKADELELRKGGIYVVTERCQDGWFKGTSNRTQKCGVFPGNYVAPAKALPAVQAQLRGLTRGSAGSGSPQQGSPASPRSNGTPPLEPRTAVSYTRGKQSPATLPYSPRQHNGVSNQSSQIPPELPPRSTSPNHPNPSISHTHPSPSIISSSWHGQQQQQQPPPDAVNTTGAVPLGRSHSAVMTSTVSSSLEVTTSRNQGAGISHMATTIVPPPNTSISTALVREKSKEKKEKGGVSLMRRLTSIKKSKSPPPTTYSMDNPVFEDGTVSASPVHPVHVRFRCIVPYPPNSDYELELRVGDIIYVHKKREDGWYKGTQQRTGRTGLFPASFVESF